MCSGDFKRKVQELNEQLKTGVKDKGLYDLIEKIVREDSEMRKWIKEDKSMKKKS
ncbi:hypothetical protein [Alkalihalobacillus sp. BA299]|uniref:hypothetical protein n=1 Tax=Alkalihalobacillus sp. BA299 TaxID=2815938 RepID=UPI001ADBD8BE|nr:hypothetical protein [Alkalihalobacillus sp. BA299]